MLTWYTESTVAVIHLFISEIYYENFRLENATLQVDERLVSARKSKGPPGFVDGRPSIHVH